MNKKVFDTIICKECKYHVPQYIHGHGEYFGSCRVLSYLFNKIDWYSVDSICGDNQECIILTSLRDFLEDKVK